MYVYGSMNYDNPKLVLASKSPRRVELLKKIFPQFEVAPSYIEEVLDLGLRPEDNARNIAVSYTHLTLPTILLV